MALFCLYAFTLWTSMTLLSKLPEYYKCTQDTSLLAFMQSSFQSHLFTSSPFCVNLLLNSPFRKLCPTYIQMCVQLSIQKALPHPHRNVCPLTSQVSVRFMSLPDLTHSSVKQLLAASLSCDCDIRCSAFISETQCIQKPDTLADH